MSCRVRVNVRRGTSVLRQNKRLNVQTVSEGTPGPAASQDRVLHQDEVSGAFGPHGAQGYIFLISHQREQHLGEGTVNFSSVSVKRSCSHLESAKRAV